MVDSHYIESGSGCDDEGVVRLAEEATRTSREIAELNAIVSQRGEREAAAGCDQCRMVEVRLTNFVVTTAEKTVSDDEYEYQMPPVEDAENPGTMSGVRLLHTITAGNLLGSTFVSLPVTWEERLTGVFADGLFLMPFEQEGSGTMLAGESRYVLTEQGDDTRSGYEGNKLYEFSVMQKTTVLGDDANAGTFHLYPPEMVKIALCLCGGQKADVKLTSANPGGLTILE